MLVFSTDRQRHIVARALALAIVAIDAALPERRPASDREDMANLLSEITDGGREIWLNQATCEEVDKLESYMNSAAYVLGYRPRAS